MGLLLVWFFLCDYITMRTWGNLFFFLGGGGWFGRGGYGRGRTEKLDQYCCFDGHLKDPDEVSVAWVKLLLKSLWTVTSIYHHKYD